MQKNRVLTRCLPGVWIFLLLACIPSCRKKHELPPNHNAITANIVFSSGKQIQINGKETKARMGWDWVGMTYLHVSDDQNGSVSMSAFQRIKSPGIYNNFSVQFRPAPSHALPEYNNWQLSNTGGLLSQGTVTFSTVNDHQMEGTFHAHCWAGSDTIIITGKFKGDYLD